MTTYTCSTCGTPFDRWASQVEHEKVFCSRPCYYQSKRKPKPEKAPRPELLPNRYYSIYLPGHPLASTTGRIGPHRVVLYDDIGPGPHPCHWCGKLVDWAAQRPTRRTDLIVDHVDGDRRNNARTNLVPSCHRCNTTRVRTDLVKDSEVFIPRKGTEGGRRRAVEKACEHCGSSFLAELFEKRPNHGRFCSRSCARSKR